ncbi:conjugative relaxase domain-containing protein, TrwC/TraI family [Pseudonocardia oroxyli]|uniref:Conjugative relaxase domain-containing protein, TrwC/TraI family n=1 Tax=Pseudonocardia oroxyli TaxID=366584 RepID=A0A1G7Z253_PSEOR|nr:conjugative relaxase domain-containing protein, TrwC/TraI family [Pseudonocardia oroxyli]
MGAVLSIAVGYSPDYLLKAVATGRENYYTGAVAEGEPPGRWWGRGAEQLGLQGLVDARDMKAVYERFLDPRHEAFSDECRWDEVPTLGHSGRKYSSEETLYAAALTREPHADAERRAELRVEAGKLARRNVAFLDVTFSVQKSVTLLHTAFEAEQVKAAAAGDTESAAAWDRYRQAVEDAIWAGNNAGLAYLSDKSGYSRVGHHGGAAGRYVDAHDWVVASFFQHDSRDHDPQLHIHNAVLNRVESPDGTWRTLDSRGMHKWRAGAAAVAERTTEERLSHGLGLSLAMRPDGKAREIVGVAPKAMALVSSRRHAVTAKAEELIADFEARFGRTPNGLERDRLSRQATFATRQAKTYDGEARAQLLDRVDAQLRSEVADGLAGVARAALAARPASRTAESWSPQAVIETALADVQAKRATWTRSDLTRAINAALPDHLGTPTGTDIAQLLDRLADEALQHAVALDSDRPGQAALPAELRLANGDSAYQAPGGRLYSTPDQLKIERILVASTTERDAAALHPRQAQRFLDGLRESGISLGLDQAAAVRGVLTSGARVETLVGPAGTGKSFVVGALARAWADPELHDDPAERRVFGLATSQVATDVLAAEGLTTRNVARWLATQERLAAEVRDDDRAWRLRADDLVVVDESAMTDTLALAAIHRHVDAAGAKLLLVGDHKQLAAVGAGGGMDLISAGGTRYELADARRFTHDWERGASLRLRNGDETVLRDYHRNGRLLDSGTLGHAETAAAQAWLADTLAGKQSLLVVDTNEQAATLSASLRAELVRLGRVAERGAPLGLQGTFAGVGDLVEARANGWHLAGVEGNRRGPINRETYAVTAVREDGGLEVAAGDERMVLPADYVADNVALAYASTVHSAQGRTVDTSHVVVTPRTNPQALYVGMSRGRESNHAHVVTETAPLDPADGHQDHSIRRDPVAAVALILEPDDRTGAHSALATATRSAAETDNVRTPAELLADAAQLAATERTAGWLDALALDGAISLRDRARIAAEDGAASLTRVLRSAELAGLDAPQVLHDAAAGRSLDGARNATNVLYSRITERHRFDPVGHTWAEWTPRVDDVEWQAYLDDLAEAADARARQLGLDAADEPPQWALDAFGAPPEEMTARREWATEVGSVAAYREMRGHTGDADALGPAPAPGQVEAFAAYRAAWRSLGRPEIDREEIEMSDGQLRVRIRAAEREAVWAPRYVANELAGTHQAADAQRRSAALRAAEAETSTDPERLLQESREAGALADVLDKRAAELRAVDDARSRWLAHTAATRAAGDRARAELALRHADTAPEPTVTAEEWLAAHRAEQVEDERHREITEEYELDHPSHEQHEPTPDIREQNRDLDHAEDAVRVPTADETAAAVTRAQEALAEIEAREIYEAQYPAEEFPPPDRTAELDTTDDYALERE